MSRDDMRKLMEAVTDDPKKIMQMIELYDKTPSLALAVFYLEMVDHHVQLAGEQHGMDSDTIYSWHNALQNQIDDLQTYEDEE